jgi:hypothetical protein
MSDREDPRYGAFMVYDNETGAIVTDDMGRSDLDEGRERVGMGIFLAAWYRLHPSEELLHALEDYARFIRTRLQQEDYTTTSSVFHPVPDRGYNYPWIADFYFRMYFQLLHHDMDLEHTYNIYFDIKDTCSQQRLHQLRDALKWNASIRNFQFIKSHESIFVQLADVLMGAINYQLRIKRGDIEGKVIAKRKIVDIINQHTPISLKPVSPLSNKKFNLSFITLK